MNSNNRELSVAEYFIQIQKEYLIAQFRSKIYFSPKNKRYWKKVMGYKAEKIKMIAERNNLNSIFSSTEKMNEFHNRLFSRNGKPMFELTEEDLKNYYTAGNEFSYQGEIYILDKVLPNNKLYLFSKDKNEYRTVNMSETCRII